MSIRLMLVDDQELTRVGLRMVLESREEVAVVGEAEHGQAALELLDDVDVDVVLMDIRMPVLDGVETTRRLVAADGPRVLVLTTFDFDEYVYDALEAGASGFLVKDTPLDELIAAIVHVHRGDAVVAPSATRRLIDRFAAERRGVGPAGINGATVGDSRSQSSHGATGATGAGAAASMALDSLTAREREVLLMLAKGLSNAEIAAEMVVSEGTVKTHVGRILTKLGLRGRVQAVVFAYEQGLVEANPQ